MSKLKKDLKKFLNIRTILVILIFLVVSLVWGRYITGLILALVFAPITFLSVRYSKMVPHVSIETNTAFSCLMGYIFGPSIGFFFGIGVGGFAYIANSFVSATYMATVLLAGIAGLITGVMHTMNVPFQNAFIIAIIIRTAIAWPLFGILGADPLERITHQASQFLTNIIIYLPLVSSVYSILTNIIK